MKSLFSLTAIIFGYMLFALSSCATQEEKMATPAAPAAPAATKAETKAPAAEAKAAPAEKSTEAKAKATKVVGDVGLLDTEKNYMILVTKEGKLITVDFDPKIQAIQVEPAPAKIADVGLGSSATVEYTKQGEKNIATSLEYKPAKGGD